ncbi:hypothetical protein AVEN_108631-1 [Araneus ventricosus]|uniref:Uncharacterized protein n=1 Tax=Araneus ventricosus TaxID=182803 RepID=A0A4Y2SH08_ARAVE|nr:hypothetical protein AVEN_108631-1 [Araneus ventricosus]
MQNEKEMRCNVVMKEIMSPIHLINGAGGIHQIRVGQSTDIIQCRVSDAIHDLTFTVMLLIVRHDCNQCMGLSHDGDLSYNINAVNGLTHPTEYAHRPMLVSDAHPLITGSPILTDYNPGA